MAYDVQYGELSYEELENDKRGNFGNRRRTGKGLFCVPVWAD